VKPSYSYAELLMKTGRFEESIKNYEKALAVDPNFVASYIGIGNDRGGAVAFAGRERQR
jgi:tetratricopeptide (TPR) repeat protein